MNANHDRSRSRKCRLDLPRVSQYIFHVIWGDDVALASHSCSTDSRNFLLIDLAFYLCLVPECHAALQVLAGCLQALAKYGDFKFGDAVWFKAGEQILQPGGGRYACCRPSMSCRVL